MVKNAMNSFLLAKLIIVILGIVALAIYAYNLKQENARLRRDVDYINKTYLRKQGATALWNPSKGMVNYDLRSFDGGLSWYAVKREGELGDYLTIMGYAEDVYPGLMSHLEGIDKLTKHVEKNGPLNLSDARDIGMLIGAGFTVKTNN